MKSLEEMKRALREWRARLLDENKSSESDDFWNEEENRDETLFDAILVALSGPSEEERKILAGHFGWIRKCARFEDQCDKCDKILDFILGVPTPGEEKKE